MPPMAQSPTRMLSSNRMNMPLTPSNNEYPRAREPDQISQILDALPTITEMVLQDLTHGVKYKKCGAEGMTAEQILRAAIIKQTEGFSYDALAFNLIDSTTYRKFCRIGLVHKGFEKSALCKNIKSIFPKMSLPIPAGKNIITLIRFGQSLSGTN